MSSSTAQYTRAQLSAAKRAVVRPLLPAVLKAIEADKDKADKDKAETVGSQLSKVAVKLPPKGFFGHGVDGSPSMARQQAAADERIAFTVDRVVSREACEALIKATEDIGYNPALVNAGRAQLLRPDYRNSQRCMVDDVELAEWLWQRVKPFVPQVFRHRKPVGLNERLRFLRYDGGEFFAPHYDGTFRRDRMHGDKEGEISQLTLLVYLNEDYEGCRTTFLNDAADPDSAVGVVPKTGLILVQQHDIMHEATPLRKGRKYCIRTDIMFSAQRVAEDFVPAPVDAADGDAGPAAAAPVEDTPAAATGAGAGAGADAAATAAT